MLTQEGISAEIVATYETHRELLERLYKVRKDLWAYVFDHDEQKLTQMLRDGEDAHIGAEIMSIRMKNVGDKIELGRLHQEWFELELALGSELMHLFDRLTLGELHDDTADTAEEPESE